MIDEMISIIIPFYNVENYIERSILSVFDQSNTEWELILINDGSTDKSLKIAKIITYNRENVTIICTENRGPANARNLGVKAANGKFICFLDADDELKENALELMLSCYKKERSELIIGMYEVLDSTLNVIDRRTWNNDSTLDSISATYYFISEKLTPTVWAKLFISKIAKECVFPDYKWKEDDVFVLKYLEKISKVSVFNEIVLKNHHGINSLTRQTISKNMIDDIVSSYAVQFDLIPDRKNFREALIKSFHNTLLSLILIFSIDFHTLENVNFVKKSLNNYINILSSKYSKYNITPSRNMLLIRCIRPFGWFILLCIIKALNFRTFLKLRRIKNA